VSPQNDQSRASTPYQYRYSSTRIAFEQDGLCCSAARIEYLCGQRQIVIEILPLLTRERFLCFHFERGLSEGECMRNNKTGAEAHRDGGSVKASVLRRWGKVRGKNNSA
jgi:hypothetical protein